jgi:hypothetical protein
MAGSYKLKIDRKTERSFALLKQWCKRNRVPIGRILNAAVRAMDHMMNYEQMGFPKHCIIDIQYPKKIDIDNRLKYRRTLTRVKTNGQTAGY